MERGPMVTGGQAASETVAPKAPMMKKSARSAAAKPAPPAAPASWFSFRIISGGIAAAACILVVVSLQFSASRHPAAELSPLAAAPRQSFREDEAKKEFERRGSVELGGKNDQNTFDTTVTNAAKPAPPQASPPPPAPAPVEEPAKPALDNNGPAATRRDAEGAASAELAGIDREITRRAKLNRAREILLLDRRVGRARAQSAFADDKKKDDATKSNSAADEPKGAGGTAPQAPQPARKAAPAPGNDAGGPGETQALKKPAEKSKADKALAKDAAVTAGERYRDPQDPSRGVLADDQGKSYLFSADDFDTALITSRTALSRDNPVSIQILLRTLDAELEKEPQDPEQRVVWARRVLVLAEAAGEDTRAKPAELHAK
jgi:hypothetical protein